MGEKTSFQKIGIAITLGEGTGMAIVFLAGFFGPLIFTPEANQGPLLGMFFTGPLGFVAGGLFGLISGSLYVWTRGHRARDATGITR